jgi:hypothetical protein
MNTYSGSVNTWSYFLDVEIAIAERRKYNSPGSGQVSGQLF